MSLTFLGLGSCLPSKTVTNDDLAEMMDTSDEWIRTRTGIRSRRVLTTETLSELATNAAQRAIDDAGITAQELDLIICTTIRGDFLTPSLACVINQNIGANCPAFDVNAACPGFIYALDIAVGYFARNTAKKILIVAAEAMSKLVDWKDRSSCVLFGDGAGAAVVGQGDDLLAIELTAKGNDKVLRIPNVAGGSPFDESEHEKTALHMDGQEVYKFAVSSICTSVARLVEKASIKLEDLSYLVLHQANLRIIDAAQKRLKIPKEKVPVNISEYGNLSSVSIPLILDEMKKANKLKKGDLLALSAFGGGLTTGTCVLRW